MPQVRVAIWNIQNFGAGQVEERGVNGQLLAYFIRDWVRNQNIDVLGIMEVSQYGLATLQTLRATLNAGLPVADRDWRFDWIKSSVAPNAPFPPQSPAQTTWKSGGRYEGSAIFWRSNRPAFRLVPAVNPCSEGASPPGGNFIDMIVWGLDFDWNSNTDWTAVTGFNPPVSQWRPFDNNLQPVNWSELDFPEATKLKYPMPRPYESRRPVYALLELNNGLTVDQRLVPFGFYHAPSYGPLANLGTYLAACSMQVNASHDLLVNGNQDPVNLTRVSKSIFGGDFNRTVYDPANLGSFAKFTAPYSNVIRKPGDGGSNMIAANTYGDRTTVQLNHANNGRFTGAPIESTDNLEYRFLPIDQLFFRNLRHVRGVTGIYDMLSQLRYQTTIFRPTLLEYRDHLQQMLDDSNYLPHRRTGPIDDFGRNEFSFFTNWASFWNDLRNPQLRNRPYFTTARSAAEFYRGFISDHLPITVAFDW
jgi:hypothetical protein